MGEGGGEGRHGQGRSIKSSSDFGFSILDFGLGKVGHDGTVSQWNSLASIRQSKIENSKSKMVPASGPLIYANGKRIVDLALKSRVPSMYQTRDAVDAGGLMYYGRTKRTATGASHIS